MGECGGFIIKTFYEKERADITGEESLTDKISSQRCIHKKNFFQGRPLWASCIPSTDATTFIKKTVWQFDGLLSTASTSESSTDEQVEFLPFALGGSYPSVYPTSSTD